MGWFYTFLFQIKAVCAIVTDDCTGSSNLTTTMHFRLENMQTKTGGQQLTSLPSSSLKLDSRSSWPQCLILEFWPHYLKLLTFKFFCNSMDHWDSLWKKTTKYKWTFQIKFPVYEIDIFWYYTTGGKIGKIEQCAWSELSNRSRSLRAPLKSYYHA